MLFVNGLVETVTVDLLQAAFLPFGDLVEVAIPPDPNCGSLISN